MSYCHGMASCLFSCRLSRLCMQVSLHFSSCHRDTLEHSIEYFWEDIEEACFNCDDERSRSISPCTFVWIPKVCMGDSSSHQ